MDTVDVHDVDIDTSKVKVTNRFHWDPHTFKIHLEECMTELKNGNRPNTYFNKSALETRISTDPVRNIILASKELRDEKIKEDKEHAKFKDTNLDVNQIYYEALFRDTVVVGDKAKVPCEFGDGSTPDDVQFVDITDGKEDTDDVWLFDDVDPFLTYNSSSKKMREKKLTPRYDHKRKFEGKSMANSSYEEKLDTVFDVLLTMSTQPSRQTTQSPTTEDCMAIVSTFPGFEEGSIGYLKALDVFLKKPTRQNFMVPKTNETKMKLYSWSVTVKVTTHMAVMTYVMKFKKMNRFKHFFYVGLLLTQKSKYVCRCRRSSLRTGSMLINEILNDHES
uniref:Uncharacterized protein n=1 Tax=Lactuca sativa TaxID=4236 RepID=A0A9R1XY91_LACSA|nr:hypothetical protein LSAT_V11C100020000 [Lactuca sativa]